MKLLVLLVVIATAAATNEALEALGSGHFGYYHGGLDWAGTCGSGQRQSPISLVTKKGTAVSPARAVGFEFSVAKKCHLVNNGHAVQGGGCKLGLMRLSDGEYPVAQFHLHSPSEHWVKGKRYPLEIHVVTQKKGSTGLNDLAVMGVIFRKSRKCNPFLQSLVRNRKWPRVHKHGGHHGHGGHKRYVRNVDLSKLSVLANGGKFYVYPGSLTTPPCAETVTFHVMKKFSYACKRQIRALRRLFGKAGNARIINKLNGRTVELGVATVPADEDSGEEDLI